MASESAPQRTATHCNTLQHNATHTINQVVSMSDFSHLLAPLAIHGTIPCGWLQLAPSLHDHVFSVLYVCMRAAPQTIHEFILQGQQIALSLHDHVSSVCACVSLPRAYREYSMRVVPIRKPRVARSLDDDVFCHSALQKQGPEHVKERSNRCRHI